MQDDIAEEDELAVVSEQPRKRGRPIGSSGSGVLRQRQKSARDILQQREEAKRPLPGSIGYAREFKKKRSSEPAPAEEAFEIVQARPECRNIMDPNCVMWSLLLKLKSPLHESVVAAAQFSMLHQSAEARDTSETAAVMNLKAEAIMSATAMQASMKSQGFFWKSAR